MTAFCAPVKKISHSYFVVMEDRGNAGLEAIVHPEETRRAVVAKIKSGQYEQIEFIHHVDSLYVEDVTAELIDAAELELRDEEYDRRAQRQLAAWDQARALRDEVVS